ncbi:MAG: hypothetical protein K2I64_06020 [Muribaculaceae bacterium]|nr:hypothetical protein [Muribaculaceae bacterium]
MNHARSQSPAPRCPESVRIPVSLLLEVSRLSYDGRREFESMLTRIQSDPEGCLEDDTLLSSVSDPVVRSVFEQISKRYRSDKQARQTRLRRAQERKAAIERGELPSAADHARSASDKSAQSPAAEAPAIDLRRWPLTPDPSVKPVLLHTGHGPFNTQLINFSLSDSSVSRLCKIGLHFDEAIDTVLRALTQDPDSTVGYEIAHHLAYFAQAAREYLTPLVNKAAEYVRVPLAERPSSVVVPFYFHQAAV